MNREHPTALQLSTAKHPGQIRFGTRELAGGPSEDRDRIPALGSELRPPDRPVRDRRVLRTASLPREAAAGWRRHRHGHEVREGGRRNHPPLPRLLQEGLQPYAGCILRWCGQPLRSPEQRSQDLRHLTSGNGRWKVEIPERRNLLPR